MLLPMNLRTPTRLVLPTYLFIPPSVRFIGFLKISACCRVRWSISLSGLKDIFIRLHMAISNVLTAVRMIPALLCSQCGSICACNLVFNISSSSHAIHMEFSSSSKTSSLPFPSLRKSMTMHRRLPKHSRMHTYNMHASAIFKSKNMVRLGQLFLPSLHAGVLKEVSFAAKQPFNVMRYVSRTCPRMFLTLFCRQSSGQTLKHCELSSSLSMKP